jgi:hypothetical protein
MADALPLPPPLSNSRKPEQKIVSSSPELP